MISNPLVINQIGIVHVINLQNIVYCQASDGYCEIFTQDGERIVISKTLSKISEQLNGMFFRVSHSSLVNRFHIRKILKKEKMIILINGQEIPFTVKATDLINWLGKSEVVR